MRLKSLEVWVAIKPQLVPEWGGSSAELDVTIWPEKEIAEKHGELIFCCDYKKLLTENWWNLSASLAAPKSMKRKHREWYDRTEAIWKEVWKTKYDEQY